MKYSTVSYLMHHGVEGQKWGIRRWQNEDGSLTPEGREHYGVGKLDFNSKYVGNKRSAKAAFKEERKKLYGEIDEAGYKDWDNWETASQKKLEKEWDDKHAKYKKKLKGYLDVDNQGFEEHFDAIEKYNKEHPNDKIDPYDDATWDERDPDMYDYDDFNKQEAVYNKNQKAAKKYVDSYLSSKYGDTLVSNANRADIAKGAIAVTGGLLVIGGVVAGTVYGTEKLLEKAGEAIDKGVEKARDRRRNK